MSTRDAVSSLIGKASDAAARFKAGAEERQEQGTTTKDSGRSEGDSTEKGRRTSHSQSGSILDLSQSDSARDRDDTQSTDGTRTLEPDRQHSTRTTDLRQLDDHESWRGVYDLCHTSGYGHE